MIDIHALGVVGYRTTLAHSLHTIHISDGMLPPCVVVEHIIGYAKQPSGESRTSLKLVQASVCLYECVLCQVVAQWLVAQRLVQKEPSDGLLILHDKAIESLIVVKHTHTRNEHYIIDERHGECLVCSVLCLMCSV